MTSETKVLLSRLLRDHFDTLQYSWQEEARQECISAAKEFDPILAMEMKNDNEI